ncbi:zinc finger, CCHC-type containing protein [Tanacetum coccineum]
MMPSSNKDQIGENPIELLQLIEVIEQGIEEDPRTFDEAMQSCDVAFWKEAINDEIDLIMENKTWVLSDLPPGCKPLGCKWIFKWKMKVDGTIDKFKARLVIQGFRQKEGINYFDTYSPVSQISTIRLLIALATTYNLMIHQMDVKIAFLNGDLEEVVYMKQPEEFIVHGNEHKEMDDPDITIKEYIGLEIKKALRKAIVYNDALTSKLELLCEPTISPQHINKVNRKIKISLFDSDDENYTVIYDNDSFSYKTFNIDNLKLDMGNGDDKIDIKQSSGDLSIEPLPNVINTDVGLNIAYPGFGIRHIDFLYSFLF